MGRVAARGGRGKGGVAGAWRRCRRDLVGTYNRSRVILDAGRGTGDKLYDLNGREYQGSHQSTRFAIAPILKYVFYLQVRCFTKCLIGQAKIASHQEHAKRSMYPGHCSDQP
ncbi:unnamed protein product [Urochloa humidicola]